MSTIETAFASGLPKTVAYNAATLPDLPRRLRSWAQRGAARWPDISLDPGVFVAFVATKVRGPEEGDTHGDTDVVAQLDALRIEDLYLACACTLGNARALVHLERRHLATLPKLLQRGDLQPAQIDDAVSALREQALAFADSGGGLLGGYGGRGDLSAWLRVCGVRLLLNAKRRAARQSAVQDEVAAVMNVAVARAPELAPLRKRFCLRFGAVFAESFARLRPADRRLLLQHYADGLTTRQLGTLIGLHRVSISRRLSAARRALVDDLRTTLADEFDLSASECESLIAAFRSRIEISLGGLLPG